MAHQNLYATWHGYVPTTSDAMVLLEACFMGHLSSASRRPYASERSQLIKSGHVFIYERNLQGLSRWTDGVSWSPSRISGDFLLYREVSSPSRHGENKTKTNRSKRPGRGVSKLNRSRRPCPVDKLSPDPTVAQEPRSVYSFGMENDCEIERMLVGSLVNNYQFKTHGLVKKTISAHVQSKHYHLVSYYTIDDVLLDRLKTPCLTPGLRRSALKAVPVYPSSIPASIEGIQVPLQWKASMPIATNTTPVNHLEPGMSFSPVRSIPVPNTQGLLLGSRTELPPARYLEASCDCSFFFADFSQSYDGVVVPWDQNGPARPPPLLQNLYPPSPLYYNQGTSLPSAMCDRSAFDGSPMLNLDTGCG